MTRFVVRFGIVLLAVLVALPGGLEAGLEAGPDAGAREGRGEGAGKRGVRPQAAKVVARSFQNAGAIAVPAPTGANVGPAAPYPSAINVSGLAKGKVVDVNLELRGLGHGIPDDLDLLLVAPGGRAALVMSDAGGSLTGATNLTLTLDDEAAAALPDEAALTSGAFRPADHDSTANDRDAFPAPAPAPNGAVALSAFDGIDPNGVWSLFAVDDETLFNGSFASGWTLTIEAKVKKGGNGNGKGNGKGNGNGKGGGKGKGNGGKGNGKGGGNGGGKGGKGKGR